MVGRAPVSVGRDSINAMTARAAPRLAPSTQCKGMSPAPPGNIEIGQGAKIGGGSVVLHSVPPHTTVAGVPARPVGKPSESAPAKEMDQQIED